MHTALLSIARIGQTRSPYCCGFNNIAGASSSILNDTHLMTYIPALAGALFVASALLLSTPADGNPHSNENGGPVWKLRSCDDLMAAPEFEVLATVIVLSTLTCRTQKVREGIQQYGSWVQPCLCGACNLRCLHREDYDENRSIGGTFLLHHRERREHGWRPLASLPRRPEN